ncbi:MAG: acyltransferase [Alphaproteobacteria bacterium]|nr:acyltransferase [Alphaproteobacteria bacterium]
MAVIAMHFSATMQLLASGKFPSLAPRGQLAVDVFFVLSGFIMAYTYLGSFQNEGGWRAYGKFLTKRAARILPLNVAVTAILIAVTAAATWLIGKNPLPVVRLDHAFEDFVTNALMLPGLGLGHSINWPAWSISVEFAAYFFFPLFLAGIFHRKRWVFLVSVLLALALIVWVCATGVDLGPEGKHNHPPPWRDLGRCFSEFVLGLATYRLYASGRLTQLFRRDDVALAISALIVVLVLAGPGNLFILLLFPPLILALALNDGRVAQWMSWRFPYFLGQISYSLYLVHENFRHLASELVRSVHPGPVAPLMAMALAAVFSAAMIFPAWLSYVWIERPGRTLFRNLLTGRKTSAGEALAREPVK